MATGLLIILVNKATKLSNNFICMDKEYYAEFEPGIETDTWDLEGEILNKCSPGLIENSRIKEILYSLKGDFLQTPPAFSAKKIRGKPAYYYVRNKGLSCGEIVLKPVRVKINDIEFLSNINNRISIRIDCSSGTYIRSIVHEIGKKLGCGAVLTALKRTRIGKYSIDSSFNIKTIDKIILNKKTTFLDDCGLNNGIISIDY